MGAKATEKPAGSGKWFVQTNVKGQPRKFKKVGDGPAAEKEAKRLADYLNARIIIDDIAPKEPEKPRMTFKTVAELWLSTDVTVGKSKSTHERYEGLFKLHLCPTLGSKPINEITKSDLKTLLVNKYQAGASKSSVCLMRDVLSGVFEYAKDEGLIKESPSHEVLKRFNFDKKKAADVDPFEADEVALILDTCLKHRPDMYCFILFLFRTGTRLGEALALEWSDIDWKKKTADINKGFRRGDSAGGVKTTGSDRTIDLSDALVESLKALYRERKKEAVSLGIGSPFNIIFHRNQDYMTQNYARRLFESILRKAEIKQRKLHSTRHTYASTLLSMGAPPNYVKDQLGHSSIKMTFDIYGKWIPTMYQSAPVNMLDGMGMVREYTGMAVNENKKPAVFTTGYFQVVPKARLEGEEE